MGQICGCINLIPGCNNPSKIYESTIEAPLRMNHETNDQLSTTNIQPGFRLDGQYFPVSIVDKNPDIDRFLLIQPAESDMYKPNASATSQKNNFKMHTINKPSENTDTGTAQSLMSISDQQQQTLSGNVHETNGKDEGEPDDPENVSKPNLFRKGTKAKWNFSDIEDLEHDMQQELQSILYNIVVGDQQVSL